MHDQPDPKSILLWTSAAKSPGFLEYPYVYTHIWYIFLSYLCNPSYKALTFVRQLPSSLLCRQPWNSSSFKILTETSHHESLTLRGKVVSTRWELELIPLDCFPLDSKMACVPLPMWLGVPLDRVWFFHFQHGSSILHNYPSCCAIFRLNRNPKASKRKLATSNREKKTCIFS